MPAAPCYAAAPWNGSNCWFLPPQLPPWVGLSWHGGSGDGTESGLKEWKECRAERSARYLPLRPALTPVMAPRASPAASVGAGLKGCPYHRACRRPVRQRPHVKNKTQKTANQTTVATMKPTHAPKTNGFIFRLRSEKGTLPLMLAGTWLSGLESRSPLRAGEPRRPSFFL